MPPPRYSERVTDALIELSARLQETAQRLRAGELDPDAALALIEECARLAGQDASKRAAMQKGYDAKKG